MLKGTYTAIVTPFSSDGEVDYATLTKLINIQADAGIDGIVPMGTTGESPTLSYEEHRRVITTAVQSCAGRMKVIAGTGANSTAEATTLTRHAKEAGADATLQITPYYNKPNQEGLYRHFSAVAEIGLPVVIYNVPGRTGREVEVETIARLSENPNIQGVKEAGGSVDRVSAILDLCDITILSGDDSLTFPMMAVGAKGVISVASNVIPGPMSEMTHLALQGKWNEGREIHRRFYRLFNDLFVDTNPVPVKAALAMMGQIEEVYRLPICAMTDALKQTLRTTMAKLDLV